jgi:hypothetical protein
VILELVSFSVGIVGLLFGITGVRLARQWSRDCTKCRIIIAKKGRVVLDASLVEWLSWNKALPHREQARGGIIFHASGISVALARPKIGAPSATAKTQTVKSPAKRSTSRARSSSSGPAIEGPA